MTSRPPAAGAVRGTCLRCGAAVLRQLVGQRAGLSVIADAQSMPVAEAEEHRTPYRLHWCLRPTSSGHELRWRIDCGPTCTFPHVVDHECPPGTPPGRRPEGALW